MIAKSPTFMFWDLILRYETLILIFVRAHRERNFHLYVNVLEELALLFFALDHVNYARWLPVHIRDMKSLPRPIKEEFEIQGNWVISKTANTFSGIPFDQAHEQENRNVKGSGRGGGVLVLQKTLLPSDAGCCQDQSCQDFENSSRANTFLITIQIIPKTF